MKILAVIIIACFEALLTFYIVTTHISASSVLAFLCWTGFVAFILYVMAKDNA
jgi:hypothetical protein